MVLEKLNLTPLMTEMMVNTLVLVLGRYFEYLPGMTHFSLEQNHSIEHSIKYIATETFEPCISKSRKWVGGGVISPHSFVLPQESSSEKHFEYELKHHGPRMQACTLKQRVGEWNIVDLATSGVYLSVMLEVI